MPQARTATSSCGIPRFLSIFDTMPMEWVDRGMLFVHGGPLELGTQTLRLKCWQRLSHESGDFFTGFHYTAAMAFEALEKRGLTHMCCGHQHENVCCRKTTDGIVQQQLEFRPVENRNADGRSRTRGCDRTAGCPDPSPPRRMPWYYAGVRVHGLHIVLFYPHHFPVVNKILPDPAHLH